MMVDEPKQTDYSRYGDAVMGVLSARGIRNPTAITRRVKAFGGYPRRISRQTVVNYLTGEHNVPRVFHEYVVAIAESERPLTPHEVDELGYHFAWSQQQDEAGVTPENVALAREHVRKALERRDQSRGGDTGGRTER